MRSIVNVLDRFPKSRAELPPAYARVHHEHYVANRRGGYVTTALSLKLEAWMHRKVAEDLRGTKTANETLEIGAGTLNQLDYETGVRDYDVVEPYQQLFQDSPQQARIRNRYRDIGEVPAERRYDRITSIATFEHIPDLPVVVARAVLLLREGGTMRVAIPNEGTLLWWLGTRVTGFEFRRRHGLDYRVMMRHEHVNTAAEVAAVIRHFFGSVRGAVFGISRGLAFYRFYECREPRSGVAAGYLLERGMTSSATQVLP